jgi:hypothetical protein
VVSKFFLDKLLKSVQNKMKKQSVSEKSLFESEDLLPAQSSAWISVAPDFM